MDARKLTAVVLVLIASLSCRALIPNREEPTTSVPPLTGEARTFGNGNFSFTIPAGWQTMEEFWQQPQQMDRDYYGLGVTEIIMITSATKPNSAYFAVASSPLAGGTDLGTRFHLTYDPLQPDLRDASQQIFDNGVLSGFEISYQRPWGEPWWRFRDIWVEHNAVIYVLSFHSSPDYFDQRQDDFEAILNSFVFK